MRLSRWKYVHSKWKYILHSKRDVQSSGILSIRTSVWFKQWIKIWLKGIIRIWVCSFDSMSLWQKSLWQKIRKCWKKPSILPTGQGFQGFFHFAKLGISLSQCFWHRTLALKALLSWLFSWGKDNSTIKKSLFTQWQNSVYRGSIRLMTF